MSILDCDIALLECIRGLNRPLVNILSLNRILNDSGLSILAKSLIYFYYRILKDKAMFNRIYLSQDGDILPWEIPSERELWVDPFSDLTRPYEEIKKCKELWLGYLTKWYIIFFKNPYFYLKWSDENGYGYYCRFKIDDIRVVLQDPIFRYLTFLESITEVDKEILEAFGFSSFFEYSTVEETKISPWSILVGFFMIANSSKSVNHDCPIYFEHVYQFDVDEVDCKIGYPYRTIVATTQDYLLAMVFIIYIYCTK